MKDIEKNNKIKEKNIQRKEGSKIIEKMDIYMGTLLTKWNVGEM